MALTEHMELAEPFERAGFTPPQAQALAGLVGVINQRFDGLETSVRELRSEMRDMRSEMRDMRSELHSLPWKIFAIMLTTAGLVVAALKWL